MIGIKKGDRIIKTINEKIKSKNRFIAMYMLKKLKTPQR
jgi:hypothetical protein